MSKVTIDTEDRREIDRLVILLTKNGWRPTQAHGLRDALREIAKPKPAEPMGRAAVVEDAEGVRWVSYRNPETADHERPWCRVEMSDSYDPEDEFSDYVDIDVVAVLFDGA